jgi:uncharacterized membrane protein YfhO
MSKKNHKKKQEVIAPKENTGPVKKEKISAEPKLQPMTVVVDLFEAVLGKKTALLMAGILLVLLFILFGGFIFGDRLFLFKDIGSDTINVFYPQLVHVADYLSKEGLPKWSFNQGMGQNILPLSVGDPFNWILYIMGKENLAYGIAWVELLKLFTGGMFFYAYLRTMKMTYHSSMIGGMAYAFCGFMVVGSGWYIFSTQAVYFALFLWGFERLLQHKSLWMFTLSVFLFAFNIPFDLYMAVLFIFFYSTLRLVEINGKDVMKFIPIYLLMLGCGVLGVLMSFGLLVSSVDQIVNSPRVAGESAFFASLSAKSPFALVDGGQGATAIARLFANDLLGDASFNSKTGALNFSGWSNYLEAPALYSGLFTLLLIPQAIALSSGRKRMLYLLGLILVILPLMFPYLRYSIWLFSGDYYRTYSVFFIIAMLFVAVSALDLIYAKRKINLTVLALTLVFLIAMMFIPFNDTKIQIANGAKAIAVDGSLRNILIMFLLAHTFIISGLAFTDYRQTARIAFIGMVALECLLVSSYTYNNERPVITKTEFNQKLGYKDATLDALEIIRKKDPSPFYRLEKSYKSGVAMHGSTNDAKVQNYFGSPSYHSFNQMNYIRFLAETDVIDAKDENQTRWASGVATRPLLQIISATKYLIVDDKSNMPKFWFTDFDSVANLKIWQNPFYLPLGFTYDKILDEELFKKLSKENQSLKKQISLLKAMTLEPDYLKYFEGIGAFDTALIDQNYLPEDLAADVNALKTDTLKMEKFSNNHIKGSIKVDKPKALFFSIPFDPSWKAFVNGSEVKLTRANLGMMAIPLKSGTSTIELKFNPPYWALSWLISFVGFLLFLGIIAWQFMTKRTKNKLSDNLSKQSDID